LPRRAVFLVNTPLAPEAFWAKSARPLQRTARARELSIYCIDAYRVAAECGLGKRINTIMQTCFFAISGVLPQDEALAAIKTAVEKTYGALSRPSARPAGAGAE
jgi:pyruvate-ferredoxin/flavodoxin oxidoreductase